MFSVLCGPPSCGCGGLSSEQLRGGVEEKVWLDGRRCRAEGKREDLRE